MKINNKNLECKDFLSKFEIVKNVQDNSNYDLEYDEFLFQKMIKFSINFLNQLTSIYYFFY